MVYWTTEIYTITVKELKEALNKIDDDSLPVVLDEFPWVIAEIELNGKGNRYPNHVLIK